MAIVNLLYLRNYNAEMVVRQWLLGLAEETGAGNITAIPDSDICAVFLWQTAPAGRCCFG